MISGSERRCGDEGFMQLENLFIVIIKYRVSQKNGDLEISTFFSIVIARLYDHFQNKSTFIMRAKYP